MTREAKRVRPFWPRRSTPAAGATGARGAGDATRRGGDEAAVVRGRGGRVVAAPPAWMLVWCLATAACSDGTAPPSSRGLQLPAALPSDTSQGAACAALGTVCGVPFATYDRSGQVVHPDVLVFPQPWHGRRYWLALTPYPNGNSSYENPSIFASVDGADWQVPPGVGNPLARPPRRGYLSDPDLSYDPAADELRLYFRRTRRRSGSVWQDAIELTSSRDGSTWSRPRRVIAVPVGSFWVSPTVARVGDADWALWYVDAGGLGCAADTTRVERRTSVDGVHWSSPIPVRLDQPGYVVWHLDVQYVPSRGEYWAVYAAHRPRDGCTSSDIFFASSPDGINWHSYPSPILARGAVPQFAYGLYRSTFAYEPATDVITLWYSGLRFSPDMSVRSPDRGYWIWSAATARYRMSDLIASVSQPRAMSFQRGAPVPGRTPQDAHPVPIGEPWFR